MQERATRDLAELVKVSADCKLTIVERAIDQWRIWLQICVKAKGQHFESCCNLYFHLSFVVCINSQFLMIEKSRWNHVGLNCNNCMAHFNFNAVVITLCMSYRNLITSYAGCVYQFLFILKQFSRSYSFRGSVFLKHSVHSFINSLQFNSVGL